MDHRGFAPLQSTSILVVIVVLLVELCSQQPKPSLYVHCRPVNVSGVLLTPTVSPHPCSSIRVLTYLFTWSHPQHTIKPSDFTRGNTSLRYYLPHYPTSKDCSLFHQVSHHLHPQHLPPYLCLWMYSCNLVSYHIPNRYTVGKPPLLQDQVIQMPHSFSPLPLALNTWAAITTSKCRWRTQSHQHSIRRVFSTVYEPNSFSPSGYCTCPPNFLGLVRALCTRFLWAVQCVMRAQLAREGVLFLATARMGVLSANTCTCNFGWATNTKGERERDYMRHETYDIII